MGTALALSARKRQKDRPKTTPALTGSNKTAQNSGTTLAVTIPAGSAAGQTGFVAIAIRENITPTPPANLSPPASATPSSGVKLYVYAFTVSATNALDPGDALTFNLSASAAAVAICATYSGAATYSTVPLAYISTAVEVTNDRPPRFPSVIPGPNDLIVGFSATYSFASTAANAALMTTPPTGLTIRQSDSRQDNALALPRGLALVDGPSAALQAYTYDTTAAAHNAGLIFVLSPVNPHWSEVEKIPATFPANTLAHIYGSSSSALVMKPEANWGYATRTPWGERILAAMSASASSINYSTTGAKAPDVCTYIFGTATRSTRAVPGDALAVVRAGTWNVGSTAKLVLVDAIGNNIISGGGTAQDKQGVEWSIDSICRLIRSGGGGAHNGAGVVKTGTWTAPASTGLMFGVCAQTTVPGSKWELTAAADSVVDLVLSAGDNTAAGNTGATFEIYLDGVLIHSGTTHNQMKATGWGAGTNYGFCQMMPISVFVPAGSKLDVRHTGAAGSVLQVQGHLTPKANPPWIVINGLHRNTSAEALYGYTWADQQAYEAILDTVAARFTDGRVIVYKPSESQRWNQATMVESDFVHQNEMGHAEYAHEIMRKLTERVA